MPRPLEIVVDIQSNFKYPKRTIAVSELEIMGKG